MLRLLQFSHILLLQWFLFWKYGTVYAGHRQQQPQNRDSTNICRYREIPYPEKIFSIYASWGCYHYTRDDMFVGGKIPIIRCTMEADNETLTNFAVPGISMNQTCVPFDHTLPEIERAVMSSFRHEHIVQRWINCSNDALSCCRNVLSQYSTEENYCPATWDAWTCFEPAPAESEVKKLCSSYSYIALPPRCNHYSYKTCHINSTWNSDTDYSTCSITPRLIVRANWHTAMLSLSIIFGVPAIVLLIFYQGNHLSKLILIRNLIVVIVTRNILVLISKQVIIMEELTNSGETIMSRNEWGCKMLTFFEKLAMNLVFACMLLEGIFLHQLLTNVFAARGRLIPTMMIYYIVAFGVSIIAALSWALAMTLSANEFCWMVTDDNYFHWINSAPRLIMLLICTVLLCHIILNIWKAFQRRENIQHSAIRTAKASLLCMPLFGLPFLFFIGRPYPDSCNAEQVYYFFSYAFDGLQGVFVAILHCYIDKEVHRYYKRKFQHFAERYRWLDRFQISKNRNKNPFENESVYRRDTTITVVDGKGTISGVTLSGTE